MAAFALYGCEQEPIVPSFWLRDVVHAHEQFIVVGSSHDQESVHAMLLTSNDGRHWQSVSLDRRTTLNGVAHGDGRTVVVGGNEHEGDTRSLVLVSTDGATWEPTFNPPGEALDSIAFGNGLFVAASNRFVYASADGGTNWTKSDDLRFEWTPSVHFAAGQFFLTNRDLAFSTSTDGLTWTHHQAREGFGLSFVGDDGGQVVGLFEDDDCTDVDGCSTPPGGVAHSDDGVTWSEDVLQVGAPPTGFAATVDTAAMSTRSGIYVQTPAGWTLAPPTFDGDGGSDAYYAITASSSTLVAVGDRIAVSSGGAWEIIDPPRAR
ncbi:MAG: hypothetical protein HOW73_27260 [Polyangiaceae bacterium]|nr:hypothetical protein [Polyangiaceae bacterium]